MTTLLYLIMQECRLTYRELSDWLHPMTLFCMMLIVFPIAFATYDSSMVPGYFWVAALFANLLSIQHFFLNDLQDGFLTQSMLTCVSLTMQIMAKCIAHCLMHIMPIILLSLLMAPLFHLTFAESIMLGLSLLLGMPIVTCISIFCAALTSGLRQQGVIMGVLIFPLIVPVIIFAVNMVNQYSSGMNIIGPIAFLAGLLVLTFTVLPMTISAVLRLAVS